MNTERNIYIETRITYLLFAMYWFLSFFEGFINGAIGAVSKYFIILFILYLLVSARKLKRDWKQGAFALWSIYYLMSLLWTPDFEQGTIYVNSVIGMLALAIIFVGISFRDEFVQNNLKIIAFFSFLLGILGLFFSERYLGRIASRQVLTLFGVQLDPNNIVALYAYGVALGLYNIMNPKINKFHRIYYGLATLINLYDILMTGSRSGIVVISILFLIVIFFYSPEQEKSKSVFLKKVMLIVLIAIVGYFVLSKMPQDILLRISGQDANLAFTDSNGRSERWKYGMQLLWDTNPIFGCGWGAFECHGTFFTFLVDTGIVGAILWGSVFFSVLIDCIRYKKLDALLIFVAVMIPSYLIGAQNRRFFWNGLFISIMILNAVKEEIYERSSKII